jgi:hypothetical protein
MVAESDGVLEEVVERKEPSAATELERHKSRGGESELRVNSIT